ncbi:nucleoside triphosphate pyrophosphohydrolase [Sphingomonas histidinilytica]|jgi:ATP diphosphatase|nr:nucleoside triphosphate pyrophosphohydrolase [Rhizorhabdus histidinilytica]MBO9376126.1 nucleoside triphosphate pyrophosphohydrolase [Rhizorhabdus histidinilytica]QEH78311.1 nucleoside triphosphate pyrophosphohydrolase [Sphingomonas sp. C8-2]
MLEELRDIMARLRDPETGCPWDVEQDFRTIAPYTIEEAYEVADAIERDDMAALRDELGDLQLQVVFHARMAEEAGAFDLKDVLASISAKMIRRHPHVFGDGASPGWEEIKAAERAGASEDGSALAGVASALPALLRAEKLQKRAARTGFDWPDQSGAREKVVEEIDEVDRATSAEHRFEEMGDLLFALVNWARKCGIDPEAALRAANAKFEKRFRAMEDMAGDRFAGLTLDEKEELWVRAKAGEAGRSHPAGR